MKKNNLILLVVLLVSTFACSLSGGAPGNQANDLPVSATAPQSTTAPTFTPIPTLTPAPPTNPPPTPMLSQVVTMQSNPFSESGNAPAYTIAAQIPILKGSNDSRVTNFNALMDQIVQDEIVQFKNDVLSIASNPPISAGSSFDLQYSVIGQRADIWSIKFDISVYADGAAHPNGYSRTLNYDLSSGRKITLDELFLSSSNYLQVISETCKAQLSARDIAFDSSQQGADPLPENYQRWNISNEGLVITFDAYQVAAYAAGPQLVTIPFSALQSIINPQSALGLFAQ
ncbi:MAG: RsiV family protein [Chloroflexi bacterium]|nr:RsiV family protein [Chloroflexota bacterium]